METNIDSDVDVANFGYTIEQAVRPSKTQGEMLCRVSTLLERNGFGDILVGLGELERLEMCSLLHSYVKLPDRVSQHPRLEKLPDSSSSLSEKLLFSHSQ